MYLCTTFVLRAICFLDGILAARSSLCYGGDTMNEKDFEAEGRFYTRCAEILGCDHNYRPWNGRPPNRWNNRTPGNGRFPGYGTIRRFSSNAIHVSLRVPQAINAVFHQEEDVYAALLTATKSS